MGIQFGLTCWGLFVLITGSASMTPAGMLCGPRARLIGLVAVLIIPAAIGLSFLTGVAIRAMQWRVTPNELQRIGIGIDIGVIVVAFVVMYLMAWRLRSATRPVSGFLFQEEVPHGPETGPIVRVPAGIGAKDELLKVLASGLKFPDYFGMNWDALEECLRDLSWFPSTVIQVHHADLPLAPGPDAAAVSADGATDRSTYLNILWDAVQFWSQKDSRNTFVVVFPSNVMPDVQQVITAKRLSDPPVSGQA